MAETDRAGRMAVARPTLSKSPQPSRLLWPDTKRNPGGPPAELRSLPQTPGELSHPLGKAVSRGYRRFDPAG